MKVFKDLIIQHSVNVDTQDWCHQFNMSPNAEYGHNFPFCLE